ncbi:recombinase family protein [Paenibacillus arenilitoris]|uniref:Recombinase family protein n=1 Tax=Paenibacillus arenilitoris TaxID=2772299 RepID=A0A927CPY8_9BACL|nr:recombinase family protein [Paenibacillus arenilitoris]MBD2871584.1 recombinase family protein [Paenibacillus arenilitoris]
MAVKEPSISKRAACFYRVSTKGQLDGDDIPMQKRACRDFVDRMGWVVVKEYIEKGVSGYKVSASDRDEIQRAKSDAENGIFDVLLCFMFDRLGRRADETPFVLEWFSKKGVELWSTKEGEQKFDEHNDLLFNYLRFWQSSGESKKTAMRVNEKHEQMTKDGIFRGGKPPYGYKLEKSGEVNKKGKELVKLVIDEGQANVIKRIFNSVYEEGLGSNRITKYLNEENILSHSGGKWTTGTVNFILRNPIYKGYMAYGKRKSNEGLYEMQSKDNWILSEQKNKELAIVSEQIWDKVQQLRMSRSPDKMKKDDIQRLNVTKSPLLFVGSIKCGHCGSPLTTTYNSKTYKLKDGTVKKWSQAKYRCSGKAMGKTECDGQTIYSQTRIERTVLNEIQVYIEQLILVDYTEQIDKYKKQHFHGDEKQFKKLQNELERLYVDLSTLKSEVAKSILGKSAFKPEMLSGLIDDKEIEISNHNNLIEKLQLEMKAKKLEITEMEELRRSIPVWKDEFENASHEKQKMMLSYIVDNIIVYKDSIELNVKLNVTNFIGSINGSERNVMGAPPKQ